MKFIRFIIASLFAMTMLSSCEPETQQMEILFKETEIKLDPDACTKTLIYQVTNTTETGLIAVAYDADWLTVDASKARRLILSAEANTTGETRTAEITVSYDGAKDAILTVSQSYFTSPLTITISDVTATEMTYSVTAADPDLTWVPMVAYKVGYDTFKDDEEIVEYDMDYFQYLAERQEVEMTLYQFIEMILETGSVENVKVSGLEPSTEYVLYAYGLTKEGKRTTDIVEAVFTTQDPFEGDITFTFDVEEEDFILHYDITPSHTGVHYYYGVATEDEVNQWKSKYGDNLRDAIQGGDIEESIAQLQGLDMVENRENFFALYTESDVVDYGYQELKADTKYILYAAKWNENCELLGEVSTYEHTSASKPNSDNKLILVVEDITQSSAKAVVSATNDDPYAVIPIKAADIEGMTDDEVVTYIIEKYDYLLGEYTFTGDATRVYKKMHPNTDYVFLAFGYKALSMTTPELVKVPFKTLASGAPEDCKFTIEVTPGVEEAWVSVTPSDMGLYYHWFVYPSYYTVEDAEKFIESYIKYNYDSDAEAFASWELSLGDDAVTVWDLYPETEYKVGIVVMDYYTGEFLTELFFSEPFTTLPKVYADITFKFIYKDYYDIREIVEAGQKDMKDLLASGDAILPIMVKLIGKYSSFYYNIYPNDLSDEEFYKDETFYAALEGGGCPESSSMFVVEYDKTSTLCAVAYDNDGNPTKIYRETMYFTKDNASPASDFISKYLTKSPTFYDGFEFVSFYQQPSVKKDQNQHMITKEDMQAKHESAMASVENLRKEKYQKELQERAFNKMIQIAK